MAYGGGMGYHLHMPSYFGRTFTEYPFLEVLLRMTWGKFCFEIRLKTFYSNFILFVGLILVIR